MGKRGLAFLSRRLAGIADRAGGVKVLGHPSEAGGAEGPEPFEFPFHLDRDRHGRLRRVHAHGFALMGQDQRGLDVSAMDAMPALVGAERALGIAEAMP